MRRTLVLILLVALCAGGMKDVALARKGKVGALVGPIRLIPKGGPLHVQGLHHYYGQVQLKAAADGLVVVNRLPLERYLLGLNEVPTRWPSEALEAQAIAARTYALWTLARPPGGSAAVYGFDICASVQCQVFSGADVIREASDGERWRRAVKATAGKAVLHRGEPILARYHSTSGGMTFNNETIFPSEGAFPYLKSVESMTEEASPVYRWYVDMPLKHVQRIARRAGLLDRSQGRLTEVRTTRSQEGNHYPDVFLVGSKSRERITAETLRVHLRTLAPDMFPGRYPSFAPTSSGRLPEVFPSNRLAITTEGRTMKVIGRGWGHGVGMSQWGAEGMARAGASAEEILQHYYTDVSIGRSGDRRPIEVGVAWGRSEVIVSGDLKIVDGRGRTVVKNALGSWRFTPAANGVVSVVPPKGFGLPLRVGIVDSQVAAAPGQEVEISVALSKPARLRLEVDGEEVRGAGVRSAGMRVVRWHAPEDPGEYEVTVAADDGSRKRADSVTLTVSRERETSQHLDQSERSEGQRSILFLAIFALVAVSFFLRKVTMGT